MRMAAPIIEHRFQVAKAIRHLLGKPPLHLIHLRRPQISCD
jgi:hypothetical protein